MLLSNEKYCEIDHIIPYSKSFDDSLSNKVLVLSAENQNKQNRIPYSFLKDITDWEEWKQKILSLSGISYSKKQKLISEKLDTDGWKARNLNDTSYIAKILKKYLETYLHFADNEKLKNKVQVRPGILTAKLRHNWGIEKNREESDLHHMQDAIVIACATQSMCEAISFVNARRKFENVEDILKDLNLQIEEIYQDKTIKDEEKERKINKLSKTKEKIEYINNKIIDKKNKLQLTPWKGFLQNVIKKIDDFSCINPETNLPFDKIVSRAPRRKITGEAHAATILSFNKDLKKQYKKISLEDLTLDKLEKIKNKENSKKLYDYLKEELNKNDNNPSKAFKNKNIYMPLAKSNNPAPLIKKITIEEEYTGGGVEVNKGIASNGEMSRVDVFFKDKKYYLVPIYVADFIRKKLPNISKPNNIEMNDKDFVFSLFKDEPIYIEHKNGEKYFAYFNQYNAQSGQIVLESFDRSDIFKVKDRKEKTKDININVIIKLEKFNVDTLGYLYKVKKEKRLGTKIK